MAFKNQMPFGVPNQMNSSTPQNNEGLGVPWGNAMFNLPRYQMPGTQANFGGGFGMDQQQGGGGGVMPVGGVHFSINRQASSDPVQNIINDIGNPLGGMTANFGNAPATAPKPSKDSQLKTAMMQPNQLHNSAYDSQGFSPSGYDRSGRGYTGSVRNAPQGAISYSPELANMYGTGSPAMQQYMGANNPSTLPNNPNFSLRTRMLQPNIFM